MIGTAQVQNGAQRAVELVALRSWQVAVPRGAKGKISTRIVYNGPLMAPLEAGQIVAGLEVKVGDQPAHDVPLATRQRVTRAGPFDRMANGLLGLIP